MLNVVVHKVTARLYRVNMTVFFGCDAVLFGRDHLANYTASHTKETVT